MARRVVAGVAGKISIVAGNAIGVIGGSSQIYIPSLSSRRSALALVGGGEPAVPDCGAWIEGAGSTIGASAAITRSGGKVTTTSVPMRSFDLSVNVPP